MARRRTGQGGAGRGGRRVGRRDCRGPRGSPGRLRASADRRRAAPSRLAGEPQTRRSGHARARGRRSHPQTPQVTDQADVVAAPVPDLIGRDFTAPSPGRRLVGDITYLPTREGWLYVATVIDLHSREVVGHAMADHMRADPVRDALDLGVRRGLICDDAIFTPIAGLDTPPDCSAPRRRARHPAVSGTDRVVLRQRGRGVVLRHSQDRDRPHRLDLPRRRPTRRLRLPGLLQPRPSTFDTRLPHPARSPRRLSSRSYPRGLKSGVRSAGTTPVARRR